MPPIEMPTRREVAEQFLSHIETSIQERTGMAPKFSSGRKKAVQYLEDHLPDNNDFFQKHGVALANSWTTQFLASGGKPDAIHRSALNNEQLEVIFKKTLTAIALITHLGQELPEACKDKNITLRKSSELAHREYWVGRLASLPPERAEKLDNSNLSQVAKLWAGKIVSKPTNYGLMHFDDFGVTLLQLQDSSIAMLGHILDHPPKIIPRASSSFRWTDSEFTRTDSEKSNLGDSAGGSQRTPRGDRERQRSRQQAAGGMFL